MSVKCKEKIGTTNSTRTGKKKIGRAISVVPLPEARRVLGRRPILVHLQRAVRGILPVRHERGKAARLRVGVARLRRVGHAVVAPAVRHVRARVPVPLGTALRHLRHGAGRTRHRGVALERVVPVEEEGKGTREKFGALEKVGRGDRNVTGRSKARKHGTRGRGGSLHDEIFRPRIRTSIGSICSSSCTSACRCACCRRLRGLTLRKLLRKSCARRRSAREAGRHTKCARNGTPPLRRIKGSSLPLPRVRRTRSPSWRRRDGPDLALSRADGARRRRPAFAAAFQHRPLARP